MLIRTARAQLPTRLGSYDNSRDTQVRHVAYAELKQYIAGTSCALAQQLEVGTELVRLFQKSLCRRHESKTAAAGYLPIVGQQLPTP